MAAFPIARTCRTASPLALVAAVFAGICAAAGAQEKLAATSDSSLPDAPSVILFANSSVMTGGVVRPVLPPPCPPVLVPKTSSDSDADAEEGRPTRAQAQPCIAPTRVSIVVNAEDRRPLTSGQKGLLAARDVVDPFNLVVILGEAGAGVGFNAHSAYGPGLKGFGRLAGYGLVQDAQGEFFGTYLIPSLTHEDPRYRRMQHASVPRRVLHALAHTVIAQHDDGSNMPNYATLLTYPISAELSNLYVPGVQGDARSTARRIGIGLATDPAGNLIAEFLPDLARRIHVRSIFIQQIVNQMASGMPMGQ